MVAAFFASLWSRLWGYAVAIGTVAAILFTAYSKGKTDAAARQTETRLKEINKAREVENEVDGLDSSAVSERLNRWLRDSEISDIAAFGAVALVGILIVTFLGPRLASSIRKIREELA